MKTKTKNQNLVSILKTSTLTIGLMGLMACSVQPIQTKVEKQVAANPVEYRSQLNADADELLNSADLTENEKTQLKALRDDTRAKLKALNQENLSLELLLYKTVLAPKIYKKELSGIRTKMQDVAKARINTTFDAVAQAGKILGKKAQLHSNEIQSMMLRRENQFE
jgi:hypothetical protein